MIQGDSVEYDYWRTGPSLIATDIIPARLVCVMEWDLKS